MAWFVEKSLTVAILLVGIHVCSVFHGVECKSHFQRKVCHQFNYRGDKRNNGQLNYFRALGPDDALHYAWSTVGYPTLFISRSSLGNLNVNNCVSNFHVKDYNEYVSDQSEGSVSIDGTLTEFSFALIFKSLVEFKVSKRKLPTTGEFHPNQVHPNSSSVYIYELNNSSLNWTSFTADRGIRANDISENGTLDLTLKVIPRHDEGYESDYSPKPWYTANSTTFDFLIKNFKYQLSDDQSRLALEVVLVRGPGVSKFGRLDEKYSKDDEYTPSVFYTKFFTFGGDKGHGHVRWKPITYITHNRKSSQSQQANYVPGDTVNGTELPGSLARALFGEKYSHATTMYLVFGTEKDDSALNSGMYTWSGSVGYGDQPDEPFSTLVILVIVIGLGIPAVLTILSIGFVVTLNIYKWRKSRPGGYKRI